MTKTDFAELKEKLVKLDIMALSAEYVECCKRRQYNGLVRIEYMVKWQHSKDAAIISELIEIIKSQSEAIDKINNQAGIDIKMVEYETVWGDPNNVKQTLEITQKVREKHFTEICSTLSETTTLLQKLRDGK